MGLVPHVENAPPGSFLELNRAAKRMPALDWVETSLGFEVEQTITNPIRSSLLHVEYHGHARKIVGKHQDARVRA